MESQRFRGVFAIPPSPFSASGELDDDWLPTHWSPEWTAQVLAVLAVVDPRRGP